MLKQRIFKPLLLSSSNHHHHHGLIKINNNPMMMNRVTKRFYTTTTASNTNTNSTATTEHTSLGDFPFTQTQYIGAINRTVDRITDVLDKFYDSEVDNLEEKGMDLEVEGGHDGVVNIKVTTTTTNNKDETTMTFVVSRQTPARELWLSSAISGPWHYKYDHINDDWICTREGQLKFWHRMESELSKVLEKEIKF